MALFQETLPSAYTRRAAGAGSLAQFFTATYTWMAGGLTLTAVTAWGVANWPPLQALVFGNPVVLFALILLQLGLVFTFSRKVAEVQPSTAAAMFLLYAFTNGITLSSVFMVYAQATLALAFGVCATTFGAMALFGALTKRDLAPMGQFMFVGLVGFFIASVANLFLHSPAIDFISTYLGILIFAGLTAWDNQRLRSLALATGGAGNLAIHGALTLYLDFINLFLLMLRALSDRR